MPKLLAKWQSLYDQRQISAQTLEQYTDAYITDKLLPMWPNSWMKISELQSQFIPKAKEKDQVKKSTNEHKTSKSQHPMNNVTSALSLNVENMKGGTVLPIPATAAAALTPPGAYTSGEKRKSHTMKESIKLPKHAHDKPTLSKTDKKHHHTTSDRSVAPTTMTTLTSTVMPSIAAPTLLSMPLSDIYSSKSVCFVFPYSFIYSLVQTYIL